MISVGEKYGCLTILDTGEEYKTTERYTKAKSEYEELYRINRYYVELADINEKKNILDQYPKSYNKDGRFVIEYSFVNDLRKQYNDDIDTIFKYFSKRVIDSNKYEMKHLDHILDTHYKCQCKCGKIHYYNEKTLLSYPKYCRYPVYISSKHTYSVKANNSRYAKELKYSDLANVVITDDNKLETSENYCTLWNNYRSKQINKKNKEVEIALAKIPRIYADNYDKNYTGYTYESLFIVECINDKFEDIPKILDLKTIKKLHSIKVYKQYKCTCILCGKEQIINCDKFGIYPPTKYGYNAYNGFWSDIHCDCHKISSFQWIVNKLLFENNVRYIVEYSFPDLKGIGGINNLKFDFAVLDKNYKIKCLIECQGEQHYKHVEEFGGKLAFEKQLQNDNLKRKYTEEHNIKLIEISYNDKKYNKVEEILKENNII